MATTPLPVEGEFQVNTTEASTQHESAVTELTDGRFVVVWTDGSQSADDPSGTAVRGQVFDADGTPSGDEFLVNTTLDNNQEAPEVTALAGGGFAVAWSDLSVSGLVQDKFRVVTQVFDSNAHKVGGEIIVSAGDHPIGGFAPPPVYIDTLADGNLVVSWLGASNVRAAVFKPDGDPVKADFVVVNALDDPGGSDSSNVASVTALANGRFVVAWGDELTDGGQSESAIHVSTTTILSSAGRRVPGAPVTVPVGR